MTEWKSIKTAPKHEKILLRFERQGAVSVAHWDEAYADGGYYCTHGVAWIEPVSGEQLRDYYDDPTHWMPLPQPPQTGDRG